MAKRNSLVATSHVIAMVCDFFFPRLGGVEMHIWSLVQCLLQRGHKVIILTHAYGDRTGVRYMSCGLKVYYLPLVTMVDGTCFPTFGLAWFPLFRQVCVREGVTLVHGHQATSCMSNEALLMASALGLQTVYSDHSLFGFADLASVHINKVLRFTLSNVDACICVSHTCRENLCLRAGLPPSMAYAIPNAIDPARFTPPLLEARKQAFERSGGRVVVVVVSRLVHRKGTDLLARVVPQVCTEHPKIDFIIGGDGPKKPLLEAMLKQHGLSGRVKLLGGVAHDQVRDVLVQGHIFLNCSLTESFCIAIVEAACAGLFVISTNVGGVTEVLPGNHPTPITSTTSSSKNIDSTPEHIRGATLDANSAAGVRIGNSAQHGPRSPPRRRSRLTFASFVEPTVADLSAAVSAAIPLALALDPGEVHAQVKSMYSWPDVAMRTEAVYDAISIGHQRSEPPTESAGDAEAHNNSRKDYSERRRQGRAEGITRSNNLAKGSGFNSSRKSLAQRCLRYRSCGPIAGLLSCVIACILSAFAVLLEWTHPAAGIERAPDWGLTGIAVRGPGSRMQSNDGEEEDYDDDDGSSVGDAWSDGGDSRTHRNRAVVERDGDEDDGETETEVLSDSESRRDNEE